MKRLRFLPKPARGFTLIELIIVMVVIAAVLVLAAPSFRELIEMQRLKGTSAQTITDVQFARTEAVSRQEVVGIAFKPAAIGRSCYIIFACGNVVTGTCTCNCGAINVNNRCASPAREIRTVDFPTASNVLVKPVPVDAQPDAPDRVLFDPATGGITAYYPVPITGSPPPPVSKFIIEASLIRPGTPPALRTEISAAGRPQACASAGTISGATPCAP